jgi:hypothetical protein
MVSHPLGYHDAHAWAVSMARRPGMQPAGALNVRDYVKRVKCWCGHGAGTASG